MICTCPVNSTKYEGKHSESCIFGARERITELEAELAKCAWHSHIEELEEDAQKFHDDMEKYKADNARLRAALKQAKELIDEVASQCPEENDWLDVARRWLAAEIAIAKCLKRLEWIESDNGPMYCPGCGWVRMGGHHAKDCWLAAEIGGK